MSSLEEIEFMDMQSMEYSRVEREDINLCRREAESLTVVIGAACSDGIVMIADKKLTNTIGGMDEIPGIKIHGDLEHILMGYTGAVKMFDIFRKNVVGDVITTRDFVERYKYANVVRTMSTLIKEFNESIGRQHSVFEMLIGKHIGRYSELHYIDTAGKSTKLDYKAIGIGKCIADMFCKKLIESIQGRPKIEEFVKAAYVAITYMERFCVGMGVGIGEDIPKIKYLYYNQPTDYEEIPSVFTEECKNHANDELRKMTEAFEALK
jgi:20S proteasome alpha/beta subunit